MVCVVGGQERLDCVGFVPRMQNDERGECGHLFVCLLQVVFEECGTVCDVEEMRVG